MTAPTAAVLDGSLDVSAVVCGYDERRWTQLTETVEAIRSQTVQPIETVLVVDNNPVLLERARSTWPDLVVVASTERRGLAAARNVALRTVRGQVVAFVDDDAAPDVDWLERLLAGYADPAVVAVGGLVEPVWGSARPGWFSPAYDWVVGCSHAGMPARVEPVRNLIGANMSFRTDAVVAADGFREEVGRIDDAPFGCEETELCIRLQQRRPGDVVLYDPGARVRHHVSPDRARLRYFVRRCYAEGRSKASVTRLVGRDALAAESRYVTRTLPRAFAEALAARNRSGLARAAAVAGGLALTVAGYVHGIVERTQLTRGRP